MTLFLFLFLFLQYHSFFSRSIITFFKDHFSSILVLNEKLQLLRKPEVKQGQRVLGRGDDPLFAS